MGRRAPTLADGYCVGVPVEVQAPAWIAPLEPGVDIRPARLYLVELTIEPQRGESIPDVFRQRALIPYHRVDADHVG